MALASRSSAQVSCSDPAAWAALPSTLRECGEIAGQRISGVLSDALHQAEELLFSNSTQAVTHGECEIMLNAAEFVRVRRERMVEDFLKHFEYRYVHACEYKPTVITAFQIDFDASQMEVVQHDLLDDSLEPGMLAEAIQNASWLSMNDLTQCFAVLLGADTIKPNDMPLSPKLIESAVSDAVRDQPWRHDAKSQVIRSLRKFFPDRVGLVYRDLAQHLHLMLGLAVVPEAVSSIPSHASSYPLSHQFPDHLSYDHSYGLSDKAPFVNQENEKKPENSKLLTANEVIEYALAAARGEVLRRQVEPATVLPASRAILVSPEAAVAAPVAAEAAAVVEAQLAVLPLPDPAVPATPLVMQHPVARNNSPSWENRICKAQAATTLAALACGARMEFRELDGSSTPLKLTWISPHKSLYLMTNREKKRTLSMGSDDLAAAICEGRVRIVLPSTSHVPVSDYLWQQAKKTA